jgi:SAM-dependent methyltransferase
MMTSQDPLEYAADLAGIAGLLQIGVELGLDQALGSGASFCADDLAKLAGTPTEPVAEYLRALLAAGLLMPADAVGLYQAAPDYADRRHQAGYLSWALSANGPLIEHVREFFLNPDSAMPTYPRDGRRVAVSSSWVGERAFYPAVLDVIESAGARHVADLGAGAAGMLIRLLRLDPGRTGVALDSSAAACATARRDIAAAGLADRLEVAERSIQSLVGDPSPIEGADVINASFIMHDVFQDESACEAVLRCCRAGLAPGGIMAIADAVPYAADEHERKFSALFTYLHKGFMNVRLPTSEEWQQLLYTAGFSKVECVPQKLPGGRFFVATK